jgi:hypothetical protein
MDPRRDRRHPGCDSQLPFPSSTVGEGFQKRSVDGQDVERIGGTMDEKNDGLSDADRANLNLLDALLACLTVEHHARAAEKLVEWWSDSDTPFQRTLSNRANLWASRHGEMMGILQKRNAKAIETLLGLINNNPNTPVQKPRTPIRPRVSVRPSRRPHAPARNMTDAEVADFLRLIDAHGLDAVFDPGNLVHADTVFRPPLIRLQGTPVTYDRVWPRYESSSIKRTWDPEDRTPEIALALDLVLLAVAMEKKWTWTISDQYLSRLPWGHPCKATPGDRPGWKLLNGMLQQAGLLEIRSRQTWKLSARARGVTLKYLQEMWISSS